MSIVKSNFNTRFDRVDARLDNFDQRMDHVEYDIHQLYAYHNLHCTCPPPPPPHTSPIVHHNPPFMDAQEENIQEEYPQDDAPNA